MTYRDETLILREKLGELETDGARLDGRRLGLELALAEANERAERARRTLATLPVKDGAKRLGGGIVGIAGSLLLLIGGCVFVAFSCETLFGGIDEEYLGTVRASTVESREDARCVIEVDDEDEDDREAKPGAEARPCRASVVCDGRSLYRGRGECSLVFDATYVEYWDHDPVAGDGSPIMVMTEHERRVVVRDAGSTAIIELDR